MMNMTENSEVKAADKFSVVQQFGEITIIEWASQAAKGITEKEIHSLRTSPRFCPRVC